MKTLTAPLLLALSISAHADDFAPLQPAHEGLWFDPLVPGVLVQVYPFDDSAFVAVNEVSYDPVFDKTFNAFLLTDFNGIGRTVLEDDVLGVQGDTTDRAFWEFTPVGDTCNLLTAQRVGSDGVVTRLLNLERIVTQPNPVECYTCPVVAVGPFPPQCRR
jgi:hypothetical protein